MANPEECNIIEMILYQQNLSLWMLINYKAKTLYIDEKV